MNEKIIAACGNDCAVCPRYNVEPYSKTPEQLRETADQFAQKRNMKF